MWLFFSTCCVGIFPLWESRATIAHVTRAIFGDLTGKPIVMGRASSGNVSDGQSTPVTKEAASEVKGGDPEKGDV